MAISTNNFLFRLILSASFGAWICATESDKGKVGRVCATQNPLHAESLALGKLCETKEQQTLKQVNSQSGHTAPTMRIRKPGLSSTWFYTCKFITTYIFIDSYKEICKMYQRYGWGRANVGTISFDFIYMKSTNLH